MRNHPTTLLRVAVIAIVAGLLAGCATPAETYIKADRAMFRAIASEYLEYVMADPDAELLDKQAAAAVIITWDEMIRAEEQRQALDSPAPYPDRTFIEQLTSAGIRTPDGSPEPK